MNIFLAILGFVVFFIVAFIIRVGRKDQKAEDKMHYPEYEDWYGNDHINCSKEFEGFM